MLRKLAYKIHLWERALHDDFVADLSNEEGRKKAMRHVKWLDHGFLRTNFHNFGMVDEGVFRSNQPTHERLKAYRDMGIGTILNLRGASVLPYYALEKESCDALGLELIDITMEARSAPERELLLELISIFERIRRPFLMHCKSGADRTGIAAAVWLIHMKGATVKEAWEQLSFDYLHIEQSRTGILDQVLCQFAKAQTDDPSLTFVRWIAEGYEPSGLDRKFADVRR